MSNVQNLEQLQSAFQSYLVDNVKGAAFAEKIVDDAQLGVQKRLNIYFDAYRFRIIEALATAYPKLKLLIGDDLFEQISRTYIAEYPSTFQNIRWYGSHMRQHLLTYLPQHPIAAEMAEFEWTLSLVFDAEDAPELQLRDLAEIAPQDWGMLSFIFQPALQIIQLRWNIIPIWNALNMEETPPTLLEDSRYTSWLFWRKDLNPQFRSMDEIEVLTIRKAISGATFAEVCASIEYETSSEEAMTAAAQFLAGWIQENMLASFKVNQANV